MKKEILIPQGAYRAGRDIPAGVYIVTAVNDYGSVTIVEERSEEWYELNEENGKSCHFELKKGDVLKIEGKMKISRITSFYCEESEDVSKSRGHGANDESRHIANVLADQWEINLKTFYGEESPRLSRGMQYMRDGKVSAVEICRGSVTACVSGSETEPYEVSIEFDTSRRGAENCRYKLPAKEELSLECSCPDSTVPCKHIAALWYAIAEKGRDDVKVFDDLV